MSTRLGNRRRTARFLVLLVCIPLMTVSCQWVQQLIGRGPPTSADIRAAMLSVYYHAYGLDLLQPPRKRDLPIRLDRAAEILSRDNSVGASARRRRAISKLAAGNVLRVTKVPVPAALKILVGGAFDIHDLLDEVRMALPPGTPKLPLPGRMPLPILNPNLRAVIAMLLAKALVFLDANPNPSVYGRECCSGVITCEVDPALTSTDEASTYFQLIVRRDVQGIRTHLDPQNWDTCVPEYFHEASHYDATCPADAASPPPTSTPPTPGSGWDGALYEHYQVDFASGVSTWFKNRLQICGGWDAGQERYGYHYGLCRPNGSLQSSVLNDGPIDGGLEKDCGLLWAKDTDTTEDDPDWTEVEGVKELKFTQREQDPGIALWTNLGLEVLVDAIADTALCCGSTAGAEDCKVADEQCIQSPYSKNKWPAAPACEVVSETSPACSVIEGI